MSGNFDVFAQECGSRYFATRAFGFFFTFVNSNDKLFLIPEHEAVRFLTAWNDCRGAVEAKLVGPRGLYAYLESTFRDAAKVAIRDSEQSYQLKTIWSLVESQTKGTFRTLDLFVRCHIDYFDSKTELALDGTSLASFFASYQPNSQLLAAKFNSKSRDSGNPFRSALQQLDAYSFVNSNGKQFWIPVAEVEAFISSWESERFTAESFLEAPDRPDSYSYKEPLFRKAARAVVESSGREIEMPSISALLRSQTPGLFEVIDLHVRWHIGNLVSRGSISLTQDALAVYGRQQSGQGAKHLQDSPTFLDESPDPASSLSDVPLRESWTKLLELALNSDASTLGRIWRASRDDAADVERIRDLVAPEQTTQFVSKHLGFCEFMMSADPGLIRGSAREASTQIQRFTRRHEASLPETAVARLLSLAESALTLSQSEVARANGRGHGVDDGVPGIYVYALPHYLKNPVVPTADDVDADRTLMKVGMSDRDTIRRFRQQQRSTELPEDPELLRIYVGDTQSYADIESGMHELLRAADHRQARGQASGTEWFLTSLKFLDALARSFGLRQHPIEGEVL